MTTIKVRSLKSKLLDTINKSFSELLQAYICQETIYLKLDALLKRLDLTSVKLISKKHYIKIKGELYINKYGLVKVLGLANIDDKLHDLLFELVNPSTNLDEDYDAKESIDNLRCDVFNLQTENKKLTSENAELTTINEELETEVTRITEIASKLSTYIKSKPSKSSSKIEVDLDEFDNGSDVDESVVHKVVSDIKRPNPKPKKRTTKLEKQFIITKPYSLLRSAEGSWAEYAWELTDKPISDKFKRDSSEYALDELSDPPAEMIWYADLELTEEKKKMILLFLSLKERCAESIIIQLL
jgi:hypothetical protein